MVKQIALSMEVIGETFSQSSCLKPLYERSSGLSSITLLMVFYQQKANENEIFKQLTLSINETYRLKIPQSTCFKSLYKSSNDQLLSQNTLFKVF